MKFSKSNNKNPNKQQQKINLSEVLYPGQTARGKILTDIVIAAVAMNQPAQDAKNNPTVHSARRNRNTIGPETNWQVSFLL
jgi:hypothetical protein